MATELYLTLMRDAEAAALAEALGRGMEALGYEPYDPFPGGAGPAKIWEQKVTAFVAPPRAGWVSAVGRMPAEVLSYASTHLNTPTLHLWLTAEMWGYLLFVNGDDVADVEGLANLLRPGRALDDVRRALAGELDSLPLDPLDADADPTLPDEVVALAEARKVNMGKAQRMIDKWTRRIFSKLDKESKGEAGGMRAEAEQVLHGAPSIWETPGGKRLRAFTACLTLPVGWHRPTLETVRAAYTVARRKRQNPNATLLPGDERALAHLPNAADYTPVYFGKAKP